MNASHRCTHCLNEQNLRDILVVFFKRHFERNGRDNEDDDVEMEDDMDEEGGAVGIAAGPDNMLYCCPYDTSVVLVIDPVNGTCSTIPCGVEGGAKWVGIAAGPDNKIYCVPSLASDVLVIDTATRTCSTILCGVEGAGKWWSIAAASQTPRPSRSTRAGGG